MRRKSADSFMFGIGLRIYLIVIDHILTFFLVHFDSMIFWEDNLASDCEYTSFFENGMGGFKGNIEFIASKNSWRNRWCSVDVTCMTSALELAKIFEHYTQES